MVAAQSMARKGLQDQKTEVSRKKPLHLLTCDDNLNWDRDHGVGRRQQNKERHQVQVMPKTG